MNKVQRLVDEVPLTCLFCEAYIDMKQSLYHKDMKWKANFINLLTLPYVLLPELSTVHLRSESFNWKHIATVMAQTHTYINRVDGVDKTLDNLGAVLQGLLSKALNEKYRHNLLCDCLDFCLFAKILNSFAEKKKSPLRCIAKFDDNTVDWDELVIKKIDVLTHWGDLRFKYTKPRDRIWNNHRTGRKIEYTQAALTREQQRTSTSRAARQQAGKFAKASRRVYDETANQGQAQEKRKRLMPNLFVTRAVSGKAFMHGGDGDEDHRCTGDGRMLVLILVLKLVQLLVVTVIMLLLLVLMQVVMLAVEVVELLVVMLIVAVVMCALMVTMALVLPAIMVAIFECFV